MKPNRPRTFFVVVIGDVHARIELALRGLRKIEATHGRRIDQVFSVGDLGLFLEEEDWKWVTGPSKHRHPEWSRRIQAAWKEWPWPLAMIGGNHEPYLRLRSFDEEYFGRKLTFANAGVLRHCVPGMVVYGLSGIHHPEFVAFSTDKDLGPLGGQRLNSWSTLIEAVRNRQLSAKRLTYYKHDEVEAMKRLRPEPHLLLLHDWPTSPEAVESRYARRPEAEIVSTLRPQIVCSGHHHIPATFEYAKSEIHALNLLAEDAGNQVRPGWALPLDWEPASGLLLPFPAWP